MTLPSTVEVLQWRCGMHTPTITQPMKPSTTATTSTIGSMINPPQPRCPQRTLSRVWKIKFSKSCRENPSAWFRVSSWCDCLRWNASGSADRHNHLYDSSLSLLPFHLTLFSLPIFTPLKLNRWLSAHSQVQWSPAAVDHAATSRVYWTCSPTFFFYFEQSPVIDHRWVWKTDLLMVVHAWQ